MTDVRMPDGTVVRFPDDMPRDQIKGMIAKKFPDAAPKAESPMTSWGESLRQNLAGMGQSLLHPIEEAQGLGRIAAGGIEYGLGLQNQKDVPAAREAYRQTLEPYVKAAQGDRTLLTEKARKDPVGMFTDIASVGIPAGLEVQEARVSRLAEEATKIKDPALRAVVDRAKEQLDKSNEGLNTAKASGIQISTDKLAPIVADLKEKAKAVGYRDKHTDATGLFADIDKYLPAEEKAPEPAPYTAPVGFVASKKLGELQGRIEASGPPTTAEKVGLDARIAKAMAEQYPGEAIPSSKMMKPTKTMTFLDLHNLRQDTADLFRSRHAAERKIGVLARDALDQYSKSLLNGDETKAGSLPVEDARDLYHGGLEDYSPAAKVVKIEKLLKKAMRKRGRYSQAGVPTAISERFRQLADNEKEMRLWAPEDQAKIDELASGGDKVQKILTHVGRAAPRGVVSGGFDLYLGGLLHHFLGAAGGPLGVAAAGEIGQRLATRHAIGAVRNFQESILNRTTNLLGPGVVQHLQKTPSGAQAFKSFVSAVPKSPAARIAAKVLAVQIAKGLGTSHLVPRIESELNDIDPEKSQ